MIKSAAVGTLLALLMALLAFVVGGHTPAVTAYLAPGIVIGGFVSPLVPSRVAYWFVPEGGGLAFVLIALVCSLVFWSTLFGALHYCWTRMRRRTVS